MATIDLTGHFADVEDGTARLYHVESNGNGAATASSDDVGVPRRLANIPEGFGLGDVTIRATDSELPVGAFIEDTFALDVSSVNDSPTVTTPIADVSVDEDAADVTIDLTGHFADVEDGTALLYTVESNGNAAATASIDGDGITLRLALIPEGFGLGDVTIRATDSELPVGAFIEDTFALDVSSVNDPPVANPDADTVAEGGVTITDLATNDTDSDGTIDLASIAIISGPANGALVVNLDGTVQYTHDGTDTLSDSYTYTVDDNSGATSNVATVTVTVNPVETIITSYQVLNIVNKVGDPDTTCENKVEFKSGGQIVELR